MFSAHLTFSMETSPSSCVRQFRAWEKVNRPWDSQLIVGISANPHINDNGQGLHAGMNAFLPKPVTIKTLTDLQCSSEAVLRTRQLDEWEGIGYQNNVGPENAKFSPVRLDVPVPLNAPISTENFSSSAGPRAVQTPTCLIAFDSSTVQINLLPHQLESLGWKVVVVNDGLHCLELLKMRTWTVVLIEDELDQLSGLVCVVAFRKWEAMNRTNIPTNIILVCDGDVPSPNDRKSWIQPPNGFNGVLRKPLQMIDFQSMLLHLSNSSASGGIASAGNNFSGQGYADPNSGIGFPQRYI
jgi:CheY-like chemotaxis protein